MSNIQNLDVTHDWIIHNATERHTTGSQSISIGGKLFSVVIVGLLFHRRAQKIGQKTELSLLKVFAELLQLHFHKCCFLPLRLWSHFSSEIAGLEQETEP